MTARVNWPVVVNEPHYQVTQWIRDYTYSPYTGTFHRDKADAEAELAWWRYNNAQAEKDGVFSALVTAFDTVFLLRCVHCGDFPTKRLSLHGEWPELCQELTFYPDWQATSELLVFCPQHRYPGED